MTFNEDALKEAVEANKTIDDLRQQLDQRESEVANAHEALTLLLKTTGETKDDAIGKAKDVVYRTQPTAEAFKAKVWNEAISTAIETITLPLDHQFLFSGEVHNANDIAKIKSLLTPESEVV